MFNYKKLIQLKLTFIFIFLSNVVFADNHNLNEVLELIQKDLKILEKAVYSGSINIENSNSQKSFDNNSEDVLTRHLLKLSEVESQFRELTNKFEEINFKIDKLSNRLSKVQSDNQLRFQDIENSLSSGESSQKLTSTAKKQLEKKITRIFTTTRLRFNFI
jgi:chromosome segregation ATPase